MLEAYHRAFARELRAMMRHLPLLPGHRVLDVACGNGSYGAWIASQVAPLGYIVGVDHSLDHLKLAQHRAPTQPWASHLAYFAAHAEQLPFPEHTFDLVWCAQSFYRLPDPLRALQEMQRVLRPGGSIAVLENDTLHHLLLPWSVELELAIRQAEWHALTEETGVPGKFYVARRLHQLFRTAGLQPRQLRTYATSRRATLSGDERAFLEAYLQDLQARVRPDLDPTT